LEPELVDVSVPDFVSVFVSVLVSVFPPAFGSVSVPDAVAVPVGASVPTLMTPMPKHGGSQVPAIQLQFTRQSLLDWHAVVFVGAQKPIFQHRHEPPSQRLGAPGGSGPPGPPIAALQGVLTAESGMSASADPEQLHSEPDGLQLRPSPQSLSVKQDTSAAISQRPTDMHDPSTIPPSALSVQAVPAAGTQRVPMPQSESFMQGTIVEHAAGAADAAGATRDATATTEKTRAPIGDHRNEE
jgi:hypothetical protein